MRKPDNSDIFQTTALTQVRDAGGSKKSGDYFTSDQPSMWGAPAEETSGGCHKIPSVTDTRSVPQRESMIGRRSRSKKLDVIGFEKTVFFMRYYFRGEPEPFVLFAPVTYLCRAAARSSLDSRNSMSSSSIVLCAWARTQSAARSRTAGGTLVSVMSLSIVKLARPDACCRRALAC